MKASRYLESSTHVLLVGAGFVAKPALQTLHDQGFRITVGSIDLPAASDLCKHLENAHAVYLDVEQSASLDAEVIKADIVISLVPPASHVAVIKSAIRNQKNVVTTSYVSPAMRELDAAAKAANIIVLNECGLDPGIDHLLAVSTIDRIHKNGGLVRDFRSYCGALPAPECSDNPLGYKFSWAPRGVFMALKSGARYYRDGKVTAVTSDDLLDKLETVPAPAVHGLVAYPNRDSTAYRKLYGLSEAKCVMRNTLRYSQFPPIVKTLSDLGLLCDEMCEYLEPSTEKLTWKDLMRLVLDTKSSDGTSLKRAIESKTSFSSDESKAQILAGIEWLGLFSDEIVTPRHTPLDTLCTTLEQKLRYEENERDMVILEHQFEIEHDNGDMETRRVSIKRFGDLQGQSALSTLVGVTAAVAAQMIIQGRLSQRGVVAPVNIHVAKAMLTELKKYGIKPRIHSAREPA